MATNTAFHFVSSAAVCVITSYILFQIFYSPLKKTAVSGHFAKLKPRQHFPLYGIRERAMTPSPPLVVSLSLLQSPNLLSLCFSIDCYPYSVMIMYLNSLRLPIKRGSHVLKPFLPVRKSFQNLSVKVTLFIPIFMTSLLHLILSNIPFFSTIYRSLVLLGTLGVL